MANLTTSEANRLLDNSLPDASLYLALTSTAPTAGAPGTELAGGSYARMVIPLSIAAAAGSKSNSTQMLWAAASADWATILGYDIYDAAVAGNRRWFRALSAAEQRAVKAGDQYRIAQGNLVFTLS